MSKNQLKGLPQNYACCPECGQVLMGRDDGLFECVTKDHGPYKIAYKEVQR